MSEATASTSDDSDGDSSDGDAPSTQTHTGPEGTTTITRDGHGGVKTVTVSKDGTHTSVSTAVSRDDEAPSVGPDGMHGYHWWMLIVVLFVVAGIIKTAIRAAGGDYRTNRQRRADARRGVGFVPPVPNRENEALAEENAKLRAQATRMEERIAVLERIVTDPAKRVADEIDALR